MGLFKNLFGSKNGDFKKTEIFIDDFTDESRIASVIDLCLVTGDYKDTDVAVMVRKKQPQGALPFSLGFTSDFGSEQELRNSCHAFVLLHSLDAFKEILKTINFGSSIEGLSSDALKALEGITQDLNAGPLRHMQVDRLATDVLSALKQSYDDA